MEDVARGNRAAWEVASRKYVEESDRLLEDARSGRSLEPDELAHLRSVLEERPVVVHLQSGEGRDDLSLAALGARLVIGIDFSAVTSTAASGRAEALGAAVRYVIAEATSVPLADGSVDLVYTGKGALMWLANLDDWAREIVRLLRPDGRLWVYDAHPAATLWTRDQDRPGIKPGVSYFGGTRVNDTFPASAIERFGDGQPLPAVEHQWPLSTIVNTAIAAGLRIDHLGEHPEPFWRPGGSLAAAWNGSLPNSFSLLASRP